MEKMKFKENTHIEVWDSASIWPERDYKCSFCKREFRSAQALGGHMNVHRRDRAKLRLLHYSPSPSCDNVNSSQKKPNHNPTISSSSSSSSPRFNFTGSYLKGDVAKSTLSKKVSLGVKQPADFAKRNNENRVWKKREFVTLDFNMGLIQTKEDLDMDLDLELRLGYS
ncbi:uncharacterized protein LOC107832714 [Nicotiana tabacum]|uniref:Transcriptional regulator SUPERMAN-like n=1 Tax=Nicotiana tabacum TaxID=4097 RepID=A0A1S4DRK5_TOBAC|nr:transcriptional regulator SUPERMAN-like [Nicotiana tomentosiformis]XP_016516066.1 PREDICTED: transcriptional regulator SUPERMAN-like [Nicotiana tabacum]